MKKLLLLMVLILFGCATSAPTRPAYTGIPPLEKGWGRIYVSAGTLSGIKLWSVHQVGPVFINEQQVGAPGKNEYIAVDLLAGTYEAHWVPYEPEKIYSEKTAITIKAGETRYFSCDVENRAGMAFGAIGYAASDYVQNALLNETQSLDSAGKLVSYVKFNGSPNASSPIPSPEVVGHPNAETAPANVPANESVAQKLRELESLRKDGIITDEEFQKKKQELLKQF